MIAPDDPLYDAERLMAEGRPREAATRLSAHLATGNGGLMMRLMLTRALIAAGDAVRAQDTAREIVQLHPTLAAGALVMGEALYALEALPEAIAEWQRALRIDPALDEARLALARAWLTAGEPDQALREIDALEASLPALDALRAQALAMSGRERSDAGYVRHLFDQFSSDYDIRMQGTLGYRCPAILRSLFDLVASGRSGLDVLDLGCGTGLGAMAFADVACRIDGIDLSPKMIEKARARGVYHTLLVADIETAPIEAACYDLLIAADSLIYLGDLRPLFVRAAQALKPGGLFLFSVESMEGEGFSLGPKRRWRHGETYVRRLAAADFEVAGLLAATLRYEKGEPVQGHVAAFTRLPA